MSELHEFCRKLLNDHAPAINRMSRRRWFARPFFEYMSGGLVWTDETNAEGEMLNAMRPLFNHRSALIMNADVDEWAEYWDTALALAPNWIGFHPSRCTPTLRLRKIIIAGNEQLDAGLAELERESEQNSV